MIIRSSRPSWSKTWFVVAQAMSDRSLCTRRKVGAVLVSTKDNHVIESGYNGPPPGRPECSEGGCPRGQLTHQEVPRDADYNVFACTAIHAEANCLLRSGRRARGATLYVTEKPCLQCQNLIMGAGVWFVLWPDGSWDPEEGPIDGAE